MIKTKHDARLTGSHTDSVAIVGMSCRFPGGANSPDLLWQILESGTDAIGEIPASRWDRLAHYNPEASTPGKMYTTRGGFLSIPVDRFDPSFFNISPKEAACMDPQQRMLLELSWEALEDASLDPSRLRGSDTGVFIGVSSTDYSTISVHDNIDRVSSYSLTGTCQSGLAGRVSFVLGLEGPSMAIDTACSSSLVAVDAACNSLRLKKTSLALAGGFNLMLNPDMQICLTKLQALSPDGVSRSFDASANGYVRSEGGALIVLKRLEEALAAGDRVLGVIRGSYVNQDGESTGISAPNGRAQEAVIRGALREAGLSGEEIDYVETHGTGTRVGDKTELTAIGNFHRALRGQDNPVLVGSVKSNIGHLEAASGVAGMLKVLLAMKHEKLPANLHFHTPNPNIAWNELPIKVVSSHTPWPRGTRPRRAGVSSFGFVGTNAHLILEEAPASDPSPSQARPAYLLPLSAKHPTQLRDLAHRYIAHLQEASEEHLADLCHTATLGRCHFDCRAAVSGPDLESLLDGLQEIAAESEHPRCARDPSLVFLYTGQGCQYPGMGRQLYRTQPVFAKTLEECDRIFRDAEGLSLIDMLYGGSDPERCHNTRWAQPLIFSVEWALTQLWLSWGVRPAATAGHSIGEYAAACLAGVMTPEDALRLVAVRGRLMGSVPGDGGMVSVVASREAVEAVLAQNAPCRVNIAAHNAPDSVVISGFRDDLSKVTTALQNQGLSHKPLQVSHAFHSAQMDPILEEFRAAVARVVLSEPSMPIVSNLSAEAAVPGQLTNPDYWVRHLREPVRMSESLAWLERQGHRHFLEVGPQPTLLSFVQRGLRSAGIVTIPSLRPRVPDASSLAESVGQLYRAGVSLDWSEYEAPFPARKASLPTYPFGGEPLWVEPSGRSIFIGGPEQPRIQPLSSPPGNLLRPVHPLLGQRLDTHALPGTVIFEMSIARGEHYFFEEHVILGEPTAPGAALVSWVIAAAKELFPDRPFHLSDITVTQPLILHDNDRLGQVIVRDVEAPSCEFELLSREVGMEGSRWVSHARGAIVKQPTEPPAALAKGELEAFEERASLKLSGSDFYQMMAELGYVYGSLFQGIVGAAREDDEVLCRWSVPERDCRTEAYTITPGELDAVFQSPGVSFMGSSALAISKDELYIPCYIRKLSLLEQITAGDYVIRARSRGQSHKAAESDLTVYNRQGRPCLVVEEFVCAPVSRQTLLREKRLNKLQKLVYEEQWAPLALPVSPASAPRDWVLVGKSPLIDKVAAQLSRRSEVNGAVLQAQSASELMTLLGNLSRPAGVVAFPPQRAPKLDEPETAIVALDVETTLLEQVELLQTLIRSHQAARLYTVTQAQRLLREEDSGAAPAAVGLDGLLAVTLLEHPDLRPTQIDLSSLPTPQELELLVEELLADTSETRVALRESQRWVARLEAWSAAGPAPEGELPAAHGPYTLEVQGEMRLSPVERPAPGPGELEIEILASGLNFKDVLRSLGELKGSTARFGGEMAGVVSRVGPGVERFRPGDAVISHEAEGGGFSSHLIVRERYVQPKPDQLTFEQAATTPICFMTALHGLFELGHLQAGERVLIHAGAGGLGLAAVQLAMQAGAEVYATAGSERKREFLRNIGVPHVYDSRSLDFATEISRQTGGRGVDLVLNSLTGPALQQGLRLLSENGRFIEVGKRELLSPAQVRAAHPTATYHAFDLTDVMLNDSQGAGGLLKTALEGFASGKLRPLPVRTFPITEAPRAFRYMARARHIGRVALSHRQLQRRRELTGNLPLRSSGCYLITGGLGGLGLELAAQMASHGVGTLVLLGRSSPSGEALERLEQMKGLGAEILVKSVDVSCPAEVDRLFSELKTLSHPLRGIVHAAGVLEDASLTSMDRERFVQPLASKVRGGWNLHLASKGLALDFFVLFSSIAASVGNRGQGNYAAGNAFLNSLSLHRRAQGLPAQSICWGPWASVGMAAADARRGKRMAEHGILGLPVEEGLAAMFSIIERDLATPTVMSVEWSRFLAEQPPELVSTYLEHCGSQGRDAESRSGVVNGPAPSQEAITTIDLSSLQPENRAARALEVLVAVAARVMGHKDLQAVPTDISLTRMGLDSLMTMDFRSQLEKRSLSVPFSVLTEEPTLERLASWLAGDLVAAR